MTITIKIASPPTLDNPLKISRLAHKSLCDNSFISHNLTSFENEEIPYIEFCFDLEHLKDFQKEIAVLVDDLEEHGIDILPDNSKVVTCNFSMENEEHLSDETCLGNIKRTEEISVSFQNIQSCVDFILSKVDMTK